MKKVITRKSLVQRFIPLAQMWVILNAEVVRFKSHEPSACHLSHHLLFHHRGYDYCHEDWASLYAGFHEGVIKTFAECFLLAQLLELEGLFGGWEPSQGLLQMTTEEWSYFSEIPVSSTVSFSQSATAIKPPSPLSTHG